MKPVRIFLAEVGLPRPYVIILWATILSITVIYYASQRTVCAEDKGTVILIRCADPRINEACTGLLNPEERPAIISNTGSIKYFLVGGRFPDLHNQIRLLIHKFGVKKIILTNHTHCGFYKELSLGEEAELADLREAKKELQEAFSEVEVRGYLIDTESTTSMSVE